MSAPTGRAKTPNQPEARVKLLLHESCRLLRQHPSRLKEELVDQAVTAAAQYPPVGARACPLLHHKRDATLWVAASPAALSPDPGLCAAFAGCHAERSLRVRVS